VRACCQASRTRTRTGYRRRACGPHRLHAHIVSQRPMTVRWQQLAASGMRPQAIARELEILPIKLGQAKPIAVREVFGSGHPWFTQMGAALAAHDPDFLEAVADRFWDTHRARSCRSFATAGCPVLVLQADAAAGGLFTDADVELLRRFATVPVQIIRLPGVGHGLQLQALEMVASALDIPLRALLSRTTDDMTSRDRAHCARQGGSRCHPRMLAQHGVQPHRYKQQSTKTARVLDAR
jgi:pimeloyl-ACP methyl ester carboxylesterase